jgi:predicted transcriptional regulator
MSDQSEDSKKSSLNNFIPPTKENKIVTDDNAIFMQERHKQHKRYLKTALKTQKKIEKISENEALIEAAKNEGSDNQK